MAMRRNEHWPQELVNDILLKLPVKSIVRFKCVAKTWSSLFESPRFVSQQLCVSKEINNGILVLYFDKKVGSCGSYVFRLFLGQTFASYQDLFRQIPGHFDIGRTLVCVYDGLLCICDTTNSRISLWNPATRKYRLLPECNEIIQPSVGSPVDHIGFGSDSLTNDYKVIHIRRFLYLGLDNQRVQHVRLAVYRMSTGSWRLLPAEDSDIFEDLSLLGNQRNLCVSGVYYLAGWKGSFVKVLAFHFSNEVFRLIDWPVPTEMINGELIRLPDDRISLWLNEFHTNSKTFDIWVLTEDGDCWSKLRRIETASDISRMFGFFDKKGNKVYVDSCRHLLLYDLDSHEFSDTRAKINEGWNRIEVYPFEESLVDVSRDFVKLQNTTNIDSDELV